MKKLITILLAVTMITATACANTQEPNNAAAEKNIQSASSENQDKTETKTGETQTANTAQTAEETQPAEKTQTEKPSQEIGKMTLRFGTSSAETSAVVDAMKLFKKTVEEKSGNQMKVEIHSGSTLGDVKQMMQNTQLGAIEMCMTAPANLADNGVKSFQVLNLPYIFDGFEHSWKVLDGEIGQELLGDISEQGLKLVGIGYYKDGARNFFTSKTPVRTLEDMKGLKIRVQPNEIDTEMALALGASPTPISFSELYSSLQSGVVEGAENPTEGFYNGKYFEVCKYLTIDEHTNPPVVVVFSETVWNKMSDAQKEIVTSSWKEAQEYNKSSVGTREKEVYEALEEEGVEIIRIEDKEKWVEAMAPVYEKFGGEVSGFITRIEELK